MNGNSMASTGEKVKISPRTANNWQRRQYDLNRIARQSDALLRVIQRFERDGGMEEELYSLQRQLEHSATLRASALIGDVARVAKISPIDLTNLVLNHAFEHITVTDRENW